MGMLDCRRTGGTATSTSHSRHSSRYAFLLFNNSGFSSPAPWSLGGLDCKKLTSNEPEDSSTSGLDETEQSISNFLLRLVGFYLISFYIIFTTCWNEEKGKGAFGLVWTPI